MHVSRDQTDLGANPGLWSSIQEVLYKSRCLILLASSKAAESRWVQKELEWWIDNRGLESLILVVTHGTIKWVQQDFDWLATDALPRLLSGRLKGEPLWVDLREQASNDSLTLSNERLQQ